MVLVIDASVAIKWFTQEPGRDQALEILQELFIQPNRFAVPELFFYELANVFHKVLPKANLAQLSALEEFLAIEIPRYPLTLDLFPELRKFQKKGLSGYDAAYVALAKMLKGQWLTFDSKAHRKIVRLGFSKLLT